VRAWFVSQPHTLHTSGATKAQSSDTTAAHPQPIPRTSPSICRSLGLLASIRPLTRGPHCTGRVLRGHPGRARLNGASCPEHRLTVALVTAHMPSAALLPTHTPYASRYHCTGAVVFIAF